MSMNPRTLRPSSTFTPRSISGLALWLDASDSSTLFQNSDGTVPATASSDPVGYWADKSGNGRHAVQATAGSRPTISATAQNGRRVVSNSTDQSFLRFDAPVGTEITLLYAGKPSTRANSYILGGATSDTGILSRFSNGGTVRDYEWWNGNGSDRVIIATSQASFSLIGLSHQDAGAILAYVNGAQTNTKGTASATITGTSLKILGAANTAGTAPANNEYGEFLLYNRVLTTAERQRVERYLSARWGITLAPQVSNADAQDWVNRVYANGGSVSSATAAAVNQFCVDIENAPGGSIRDRFLRLNLFCGSFQGAFVPLFRGPSLGGTQYGGATDTNEGGLFVTANYNETGASGGLQGASASSKRLRTGLAQNTMPTGDLHLAAYEIAKSNASSDTSVGARNNSLGQYSELAMGANTSTALFYNVGTGFATASDSGYTQAGGFLMGVSVSTALTLYKNGSSAATGTVSAAASTSSTFAVFSTENESGTGADFTNARLGGYSIGLSMDAGQAAAYNTAMQSFQAALTRNV